MARRAGDSAPGVELRTALARAVAPMRRQIRGLVVDAGNLSLGWRPLDELVAEDACFAIEVDTTVVALDADTPDAASALEPLARRLARHGVTAVVVASGTPGHRHLFARVQDHGLRHDVMARARRAGLDVRRGGSVIRPPGTRHRSGAVPELCTPATWEQALAALAPTAPVDTRLSPRLFALIRNGDTAGRYRRADGSVDDSRVVQAICNIAVLQHVPAAKIRSLLDQPWALGGRSLQRRAARRPQLADAFFDRTWQRAQDWSGRPPVRGRAEALVEIEQLVESFDRHPRSGQAGSSDVTVFHAAAALARRHGGRQAPMSVRELADASGRATGTVIRSLRRLRADGWLTLTEQGHHDTANTYRLEEPPWARRTATPLPPAGGVGCGPNLRDSVQDPGHDAFSHGALGPGGWRILRELDVYDGAATAAIAERLGLHPGTVRRHLARLAADGLAWCDAGVWYLAPPGEAAYSELLDAVAGSYQTLGRRSLRRHRFDEERHRWRALLLDRLPDRPPSVAPVARSELVYGYPTGRAA
jgi:DNA-binding MarR family transcriptional regulator